MIITPTTLKTEELCSYCNIQYETWWNYSTFKHFVPSDLAVLINDGSRVWFCGTFLKLLDHIWQIGECNITSDGTRFLTGETYVRWRDLLLLHFLCAVERMSANLSDEGSETETSLETRAPGGHGNDPSDSLVNQTYVRSHMPTNISYTVNVKMSKICTFGKLKNIPDGVFMAVL